MSYPDSVTTGGNGQGATTRYFFNRARSGGMQRHYRTKARPQPRFTFDPQTGELRGGTAGTGFIKSVSTGAWSCEFQNAAQLKEILICAGPDNSYCR